MDRLGRGDRWVFEQFFVEGRADERAEDRGAFVKKGQQRKWGDQEFWGYSAVGKHEGRKWYRRGDSH
jgi:hypothetical protein